MGGRIAAGAAAIAISVAACGSPSTSSSPSTVTVTQTPAAPSAVAAPMQTMTEWKHQAADSVSTVGGALVATGKAMQAGPDFPAMRVGCADLRSAADGLDRQLPSPDETVNAAFRDTIDNYRSASQICMTLGPFSSTEEIRSMEKYMDAGADRMYDAFDALGLNIPRR